MIPKTIFQTHENDYRLLPEFIKKMIENWIVMNPGFEHIYVNSEQRREYIKMFLPEIINKYDNLEGKFQADIWRYLILYNNGGVYSDVDSICWSSLNNLLEDKYLNEDLIALKPIPVPKRLDFKYDKLEYVNNSNFACIKESKVMKLILEKCINEIKDGQITPGIFSKIVLNNKNHVLFVMNEHIDNNDEYNFGTGRFFENDIFVKYLGKESTYQAILKNYKISKRLT